MSRTILTLGSLNTDLVTTTPRLPHAGETLASKSFATHSGGKGLNQCIAVQRLSRASASSASPSDITAQMMGCVGSDHFAPALLSTLSSNGLTDHSLIKRAPEGTPSGVAVIIVDESTGENRILYTAGANAHIQPTDLPHDFFTGKHPDISLVVVQLETPLPAVLRLLDLAAAAEVKVLVNAAPAAHIPANYFPKITYFVVNETEAAYLSGVEASDLDSEEGVRKSAQRFLEQGAGAVVVTLGARGCYWVSQEEEEEEEEKGGRFVQACRVEKVVDTTGAGDTWVGAFAVAVTEGRGVKEGVEFARRAAAVAVQRVGAGSGPWRGEVEE